jgi:hypothetical protein
LKYREINLAEDQVQAPMRGWYDRKRYVGRRPYRKPGGHAGRMCPARIYKQGKLEKFVAKEFYADVINFANDGLIVDYLGFETISYR